MLAERPVKTNQDGIKKWKRRSGAASMLYQV
jgi:hypothetical protein